MCNYTLLNCAWFLTIFTILIVPIILSELFDISFQINDHLSITYFSIISILYFTGKTLFSIFNYYKFKKINSLEIQKNLSVGVQVTGWKEDKELFEKTLIALKLQTYKNIKKIIFCSDGNDDDDYYLAEIFKKVFEDSLILNLDKKYYDMDDNQRKYIQDKIEPYKYVCLLQPHAGKRHGMYTQMKLLTNNENIDLIMLVDSDCIYDNKAIEILVRTNEYTDADIITGDVKIYNIDNLLAFLISLKFWFAFNFERAAQSFFGCVGCVPGPFGLYKKESLKNIIDQWIEQKLLGKECTFGDDRHLTNLILINKGKVFYNFLAKCYTDTPITIKRFATQQTRWGKSFLREYFINIKSFRLDTLWLSFEQTFVFFIVYYVIYFMTINFFKSNLDNILIIFASLITFGYIRSFIAIFASRDFSFIIFPLYTFLYFYILFPVKLWTLFTFNVTSWGTGNRLTRTSKIIDFLFIIIWFIFTSLCIIYSFFLEYPNYSVKQLFLIIYIVSNIIFLNVMFYCYFFKKIKTKLNNILTKIIQYEEVEENNYIEEIECDKVELVIIEN